MPVLIIHSVCQLCKWSSYWRKFMATREYVNLVDRINLDLGSSEPRWEVQEGSWKFGFDGYRVTNYKVDGLGLCVTGLARAERVGYCRRSYCCFVGGEPVLNRGMKMRDGMRIRVVELPAVVAKHGSSQFRILKWQTVHKLIAYVKRNEPNWWIV